MSETVLTTRIIQKHDTEANWLKSVYVDGIKESGLKSNPFIPRKAEIIVFDADENQLYGRAKIGDGETNVIDLPFIDEIASEINSSSIAYTHDVPENSLGYAKINKFGGMSYKTKNLFNPQWLLDAHPSYYITDDGFYYGKASVYYATYGQEPAQVPITNFKPNTRYTISFEGYSASLSSATFGIQIFYTDGTKTYTPFITGTTNAKYSFVSETEKSIAKLAMTYSEDDTIYLRSILVAEGVDTPYEPYGLRHAKPTAFKSAPSGENKFNPEWLLVDDGVLLDNGYYAVRMQTLYANYFTDGFPMRGFKENTQYTLSLYGYNYVKTETWVWKVFYTDGTNEEIGVLNSIGSPIKKIATTAAGKTVSKIAFTYYNADTCYIKDICVREGIDPTYIPYTESTLAIPTAVQALDSYGLGINENLYNYVDWIAKKYHKAVGMVDLGMLDWQWSAPHWVSPDIASIALINWRAPDFLAENYNTSGWDDKTQGDIAQNGEGYIVIVGEETSRPTGKLLFALKNPEVIDISDILPDANSIAVQANGSITAINDSKLATPIDITYYEGESKIIGAEKIVGNLIGTADRAISDANGNDIIDTYAAKDELYTKQEIDEMIANAGSGESVDLAESATRISVKDTRDEILLPNSETLPIDSVCAFFTNQDTPTGHWTSGLSVAGWGHGYATWQLASNSDTYGDDLNLYMRSGRDDTWNEWRRLPFADEVASNSELADIKNLAIKGVASYIYTETIEGSKFFKISINDYKHWMMAFTIRTYQGYVSRDIRISGYNYAESHWYEPKAILVSASAGDDTSVYFGYDSDFHLWVAIPAQNYAGISIQDVVVGYSGYTEVDENLFTITLVDNLNDLGIIQSTQQVYRPATINEVVPKSGGTFDGTITAAENSWKAYGSCGLNMNNSDIDGVNAIIFGNGVIGNVDVDVADSLDEGLIFGRTDGTYDCLQVYDGQLRINRINYLNNQGEVEHLNTDVVLTDVSNLNSSKLTWGQGSDYPNPLETALMEQLNANRFAFMDPDDINVEYSNDGGSTWHTYIIGDTDNTNNNKVRLVTAQGTAWVIGAHTSNITIEDQLRITLTPTDGRYFTLNKIAFNVSTQGAKGLKVKYELFNGDQWYNPTTVNLGGWPEWNILTCNDLVNTGYSLRFTFSIEGLSTEGYSSAAEIRNIFGYGSSCYTSTNNAMYNGHIYSVEMDQTANFPAGIIANKSIVAPENKWFSAGESGINLNNSDIIGVNTLYLGDSANACDEGIAFPRSDVSSSNQYDVFRVYDGSALLDTINLNNPETSISSRKLLDSNNYTEYVYTKAEVDQKIADAGSGGTIDLSNYYTKTETYSTGQIEEKVIALQEQDAAALAEAKAYTDTQIASAITSAINASY